jgi:2-polyprenyl-3-methyl-5-hydroxy-6-metoxy-1,4-benzoquinol methylase
MSVPGSGRADAAGCYLCGSAGSCVLAGVTDPSGSAHGTWSFLRCAACDLIWLDPPLHADRFDEAYHDAYYTHDAAHTRRATPPRWAGPVLAARHGYSTEDRPNPLSRLLSRAGVLADGASAHVRYLHAVPGGRLLDVGCGSGDFLLMMQGLGWRVAGVDPDARAVAAAPPEIREVLVPGTLESVAPGLGAFDAITLHHVIEHLDDPVATLRCCAGLLRPGGKLVVMTPNAAALGRRLFRRSWLHWDPPRHRFLFTATSVTEVARRAGLRVDAVRTTARAARWTWQQSGARRQARGAGGGPPGRARGLGAAAFQILEHALLSVADCGEELVLIGGTHESSRR